MERLDHIAHVLHHDANLIGFFQKELEYVKTQTYDIKYPELKARNLIPVSTDGGPGANEITYQQFDQTGFAKVIANYADDLPRAYIRGAEFTSKIRSLGDSYGYTLQEIRNAQFAGKPLDTRFAAAARKGMELKINDIAWKGDAESGLFGLLNYPNITRGDVAEVNGQTEWSHKTPDEILADLNNIVNAMIELTNGVEIPDTILLPLKQYRYIATKRYSDFDARSILDVFLGQSRSPVTMVDWVLELKGAGTDGVDIMVAYKRDPNNLELCLPSPFEQLPIQERNLELVVNCHARCGGVLIYYPLSVSIGEGI